MKDGTYKTTFLGKELPLIYVTHEADAEQYLSRLLEQNNELTAIDTETYAIPQYRGVAQAALSVHLSKVRLIQIFTGKTALVFDCLKIDHDSLFTRFLERGRFVGHNSLFDLQYFYRQFGVNRCDIGCTYLAAKIIMHALRPTDEGLSASLRNLVNALFKEDLLKEMQISDFSEPELSFEQVEYAALDAVATYHLAQKLAPKIPKLGLKRIYKLYKDAQHPIAKMQLNGLALNVDAHRDLIVRWRQELYEAKKKLLSLTNLSDVTPHKIASFLQRTLPPATLHIWPRTDTGKLATDAHVFSDFDFLEIVKPFSEFQKLEKLCTAFGSNLIEQINPATHRLHPQFRIAGARTGRLSCSQPNLQQLPREKSVRSNFVAGNGYVFLCADYSQIEIRVGAELSRDATMLKAYKEGIDLHRLTASLICHKRLEDVTKEDRQKAKAFNFGLMFGLGAKKFSHYAKKSYGATVTQQEAEAGVKTFRDTYSGYRKWQLEQPNLALRQGYVVTPCGKRRCLNEEIAYGASMNTPVQGGAGECMLHSLIRMNNMGLRLVNCVHDEVLVECSPHMTELTKHQIEDCMVQGFKDVFPQGITRDLVECKAGKTWAEAK